MSQKYAHMEFYQIMNDPYNQRCSDCSKINFIIK